MRLTFAILYRSLAFRLTLLVFASLNLWTWARHGFVSNCCDREISYGFPIPFHISGGIAGMSDFYVLGLLLDVSIALTTAVLVTWIVKLSRS